MNRNHWKKRESPDIDGYPYLYWRGICINYSEIVEEKNEYVVFLDETITAYLNKIFNVIDE